MQTTDLKTAIITAKCSEIKRVETPEWAPGLPCVWVRALDASELSRLADLKPGQNELTLAAALGMVTEDGESLAFTDPEIELLGQKHGGCVKRIYDAVMVLTGFKGDPAKNSPATTGAAGG